MAVECGDFRDLVAALCRCAWRSANDTDNRWNWLEDQEGHLSTFPTCRRIPTPEWCLPFRRKHAQGARAVLPKRGEGAGAVIPKSNGARKLQPLSTKRTTVRPHSLAR